MKNFLIWLFVPYSCEYESNWQTCCYNRIWYALGILDVFLVMLSGGALIFGRCADKDVGWAAWTLTVVIITFMGNIVQLAVVNEHPKLNDLRERLYKDLTKTC